jgi:hypothetical protein
MRSITKADVEHYYGGMVMTMARSLATKPWDDLTFRSRQRLLNKAVKALHAMLNNKECVSALFTFTRDRLTNK